MKIFNFEIPGMPNLVTNIFESWDVNPKLYGTDDKFANYGIESF